MLDGYRNGSRQALAFLGLSRGRLDQSGASAKLQSDIEVEDQDKHASPSSVDKNWAEADRIRDELLAQGIQLKDGKDPVTGERVTTWEVKR